MKEKEKWLWKTEYNETNTMITLTYYCPVCGVPVVVTKPTEWNGEDYTHEARRMIKNDVGIHMLYYHDGSKKTMRKKEK